MPKYTIFTKLKSWYKLNQFKYKASKKGYWTFAEQVEYSRRTLECRRFRGGNNVMGRNSND